jgi:hypothetical protein
LSVACPTGQAIEIEIGSSQNYCQLTIGSQADAGALDITNNTAAGDISVQATATHVAYTVTYDKIGCPLTGTGSKTGGTYVQESPVTLDSTNGADIHVG